MYCTFILMTFLVLQYAWPQRMTIRRLLDSGMKLHFDIDVQHDLISIRNNQNLDIDLSGSKLQVETVTQVETLTFPKGFLLARQTGLRLRTGRAYIGRPRRSTNSIHLAPDKLDSRVCGDVQWMKQLRLTDVVRIRLLNAEGHKIVVLSFLQTQ